MTLRQKWMEHLQSNQRDVTLELLTIPGTHDTATWTLDDVGDAHSKTQGWTLEQQLNQGIRFLDIRLVPEMNGATQDLMTYHGDTTSCHIWFSQIIKTCRDFLDVNTGETIIMSISNEHSDPHTKITPKISPGQFARALDPFLKNTMTTNGSLPLFHIARTIPKLSDVKGRIVLFRRYEGIQAAIPPFQPYPPGIDAMTGWPDDNETTTPTSGSPRLMVQDIYKMAPGTLGKKVTRVNGYMSDAQTRLSNMAFNGVWWLNFSSTTNGEALNEIARQVNAPVFEHMKEIFKQPAPLRLGTVVMDFPSDAMVDLLIAANIDNEPDVVQAHRPYVLALYTQTRDGSFITIGNAGNFSGTHYPWAYVGPGVGQMFIKVDGNMNDIGRIYPGDTVKLMTTEFTHDEYIYLEGVGYAAGGNQLFYTKSSGYYDGPYDVEWKVEVWDKTPNVTPGEPIKAHYMLQFRNCSKKIWPQGNGLLSKTGEGHEDKDNYLACYDAPSAALSVWKVKV